MALTRRKKARGAAQREIGRLSKSAARMETADFLGRATEIAERYLTSKFGFAATGMTLGELSEQLRERHVTDETVSSLARFMETADALRFGGSSDGGAAKENVLKELGDLIGRLDSEARKARTR